MQSLDIGPLFGSETEAEAEIETEIRPILASLATVNGAQTTLAK